MFGAEIYMALVKEFNITQSCVHTIITVKGVWSMAFMKGFNIKAVMR